tara:strand:- start:8357 stop:8611 length:255 start_codon:yes stop_codon:yes gene_type:complete
MSKEHYQILKKPVVKFLNFSHEDEDRRSYYDTFPTTRLLWDILHNCSHSGLAMCIVLYNAGYNDSHIETALKKIHKEWEEKKND